MVIMKKALFNYLGVGILLFIVYSCSSSESTPTLDEQVATCYDGILNGEEITVDCGGVCIGFCALDSIGILEGELAYSLSLDADVVYTLRGPYLLREGAQLNIPGGTIIKADPGSYIAIGQGARFNAFGLLDNPVVITSNSENPAPGDWGGIVICGTAPILQGGIGRTEIIDIFYGGDEQERSSGVFRNLRIEYAGETGINKQHFDGIAFYGVGSQTTITNIQVYESLGNGIRFIGGYADANKLVTNNSGQNSIVLKNNWSGNGDNWYLKNGDLSGIKITSDDELETTNTSISNSINNISIVGSSYKNAMDYGASGGVFTFSDIYTLEMMNGIKIASASASTQIDQGYLTINNIQFENPLAGFMPTDYNGSCATFYEENETEGAGNKDSKPEWANGWTKGLD